MDTVLIFAPSSITRKESGFLLGFYYEDKKIESRCFYILDSQTFESKDILEDSVNFYKVGCFSKTHCKSRSIPKNCPHNVWLNLKCDTNDVISVEKCIIRKSPIHICSCLLILYDEQGFNKSELLLNPQNFLENDHFKILAEKIRLRRNSRPCGCSLFLDIPVTIIFTIFTFVYNNLSKLSSITKYSILSTHLLNYSRSALWISFLYRKEKHMSIKLGNYFVSVLFDILAGFLVYYTITRWKSPDEIFESLSYCTESVILTINNLVTWLMGSPAGLKLNQPLSSLLGSLVFYYLEIWRNFLNLVRPVLEIAFLILIKVGFLGVSFQLAMLADVFAIISFHVYCIYIYAARLYEIQGKGVYSLSRLVLGWKRNPEPGKVDSCPYSTEELLIGTISFAVLLFLLPTTLVYYIVFTVMRVGALIIRGLMTRTMYYIQTLPVYTTVLWLFFPSYTASTVKLTPHCSTDSKHGLLVAKLINASWLETVRNSTPDAVQPPTSLSIGNTLWRIFLGKLI